MRQLMMRYILVAVFFMAICLPTRAHDPGRTSITWNREISRIFYARCASCHHEKGTAFSLMTFPEVQPRAIAIKEAVLSRRMPPWGGVKGFGDFRNDQSLTQQELELITDWVEGGTARGNNSNVLPKKPKIAKAAAVKNPKDGIIVSGSLALNRAVTLDGILPDRVPPEASMQIFAVLPNGDVEPLVWLHEYKDNYRHPFLFRKPVDLPPGTVIEGVRSDASIILIPGKRARGPRGQ